MNPEILHKYDEYLVRERLFKTDSLYEYRRALRYLGEELDIMEAKKYSEVRDAIIRFSDRYKLSQNTTVKCSRAIVSFYKWAQLFEYLNHNPYPWSSFKKVVYRRPDFVSQEDFDALIDDPLLNTPELTIIWFLWDTGVRVGEMVKLTQDDIDFKEGVIHVSFEVSKGEYSDRYVPFGAELRGLLTDQIEWIKRKTTLNCLFVNHDWRPADERDVQETLAKIGRRKTPRRRAMRLTPHMFRHGFGVRKLEAGYPEIVVMRQLGHASLEMTAHYVNMSKSSAKRFSERYKYSQSSESFAAQGI